MPDLDMSAVMAEIANRWSDETNYMKRPSQWIKDKLGEHAWSQQDAIGQSVVDNRYTAVHSAHDLGKSFIGSRIGAWWMDVHAPGEAFLVSTAPTAAQVSAILWREISIAHRKGNLRGKINRAGYPQWYFDNELVGYGRKPADYEESAFQGIHARYPLIVIDEAGGVARHLYDAVDALATNTNARVLAIGNPDDPGSHFASICKPGSGWNVIHLDGLRSPNITESLVVGDDPENPKYPLLAALVEAEGLPYSREAIPANIRDLLISPLWIEERIERWAGVSKDLAQSLSQPELHDLVLRRTAASALFTAKVRGNFPTSGSEGVIPLGWVQQAVNRWHDIDDAGDYRERGRLGHPVHRPGHRVVGADIARTGGDETALAVRYGNFIPEIHRMRSADTMETADWISAHLMEIGSVGVIDVIGIGAGVYDYLRRMRAEGKIVGQPIPFNAAAQSSRRDMTGEFRFRNDRAAAWWNLRELLDPSKGSTIALPDDERLIEELVAPQFKHNVGGIIQVESKDDIRGRLGRSTDSADAVIQAFWVAGEVRDLPGVRWGEPTATAPVVRYAGYDPFTDEGFKPGDGLGMNHLFGSMDPSRGWQ